MDTDLSGVLERWSTLGPVRWGIDDCAACCAAELWRVTGSDPARRWRGRDGRLSWGEGATVSQMVRGVDRDEFASVAPRDAPALALGLAQIGAWSFGLCLRTGWWIFRADLGAMVVEGELVRRAWIYRPN